MKETPGNQKCNELNCDDIYDGVDDDEDNLCDGAMNYANYLVNECHQSSARQNTDNDDDNEKIFIANIIIIISFEPYTACFWLENRGNVLQSLFLHFPSHFFTMQCKKFFSICAFSAFDV